MARRSILIIGGGTAGWLTAAYLARMLQGSAGASADIVLVESPDIAPIGVGEGAFPTLRDTLRFIGVDEAAFVRGASGTFKQGIRFTDWVRTPEAGGAHHFFHPFEAPFQPEGMNLVPYWLLKDQASRLPFAEAMTIQHRVAAAKRAPKRTEDGEFSGALNYAYHFDAGSLAALLAARAKALGVRHIQGTFAGAMRGADGGIDHVVTREQGELRADLYVDCTGFRAELIGGALGVPFVSTRRQLFADRAIACKIPYESPEAPIESATIAAAHEAGWIWDIGLAGARGLGIVYSSDHMDEERAAALLAAYAGPAGASGRSNRLIRFEAGWRARQWERNCVAVGLSGGFLEPLEATGLVMIEAAVAMIAELFPHHGPIDAPARRFNQLMVARYENIVNFLKLHYCLSRRTEPFWRDNRDPGSIPDRLAALLGEWRYRPPARFDFDLDVETFAFFNYQYVLYGMGFETDLGPARGAFPNGAEAERLFARIRSYAERAARDLPSHRALVAEIDAAR